jgi:hypothetical protein
MNATLETFQQEVVDASFKTPVVVDFGRNGASRASCSVRFWKSWPRGQRQMAADKNQ